MISTSKEAKYNYLRRISGLVLMVFSVVTLALSIGQAEAQKTGKNVVIREIPSTAKAESTVDKNLQKNKKITAPKDEIDIIADTILYHKNKDEQLTITSSNNQVKLKATDSNQNPLTINKKDGTVSGVTIISKSEEVPINDSIHPPLYLLDGKEINAEAMKELDANSIKEINVLKGENALNKYGEKGKNGVIEIKTKTKEEERASKEKNLIKTDKKTSPAYYVDGKEVTNEEFNKIASDKIESVTVLKGENATKKYGEKGKNGVVEVLLKKPVT